VKTMDRQLRTEKPGMRRQKFDRMPGDDADMLLFSLSIAQ